mmetsp:Transcript_25276/g.75974  ORF Transcript_25276/g.75974 Transcript_25276/m.75974 type:complete len:236 (+) Transcript_25276:898-1605(+)
MGMWTWAESVAFRSRTNAMHSAGNISMLQPPAARMQYASSKTWASDQLLAGKCSSCTRCCKKCKARSRTARGSAAGGLAWSRGQASSGASRKALSSRDRSSPKNSVGTPNLSISSSTSSTTELSRSAHSRSPPGTPSVAASCAAFARDRRHALWIDAAALASSRTQFPRCSSSRAATLGRTWFGANSAPTEGQKGHWVCVRPATSPPAERQDAILSRPGAPPSGPGTHMRAERAV